MAIIYDNDLDDTLGWEQAPKSVACRARQPVAVADLDCFCRFVGITAYEHCPLDCLRAKSFQVDARLAREQCPVALPPPDRAENNEQERQ